MGRSKPDPLRKLAGDAEASVRAVAGLPQALTALQRIADFDEDLAALAQVAPALEQLATLRETLDDLARVAPALERLASLDELLASLP